MNPQISVLMCAYNTEAYVEKAIRSILRQTFCNFEFLIIDNGSTDCTGKIIDRLSSEDDRIYVIHNKKNEPPSNALNKAIQGAKGKYLYIIDSDDWAESKLLEKMFERVKSHNAQLVYTGFYMDYYIKNKEYSYVVSPNNNDYTQQEFREKSIDDFTRMVLTNYWNKLYSLDYLHEKGIYFRDTKMFDYHFNMDVMMDVCRVSSISDPLYHMLRNRAGSYMKSNPDLNQKNRDHFAHTMQVYEHWGICSRDTIQKIADYYLAHLIRCVIDTVNKCESKEYKKEELRKIFDDKWTIFSIESCKRNLKNTIFVYLLRSKNYILCRMFGWVADSFERFMPRAYYTMRAIVAQQGRNVGHKSIM